MVPVEQWLDRQRNLRSLRRHSNANANSNANSDAHTNADSNTDANAGNGVAE